MSIVLRGLGLDVDSNSSIVAFGLTLDPQTPEEAVQAIGSASIENLYVVDYGGRKRRPTAAEYRRFKRIARRIDSDRLAFRKRGRGVEWYLLPAPRFNQKKAA